MHPSGPSCVSQPSSRRLQPGVKHLLVSLTQTGAAWSRRSFCHSFAFMHRTPLQNSKNTWQVCVPPHPAPLVTGGGAELTLQPWQSPRTSRWQILITLCGGICPLSDQIFCVDNTLLRERPNKSCAGMRQRKKDNYRTFNLVTGGWTSSG